MSGTLASTPPAAAPPAALPAPRAAGPRLQADLGTFLTLLTTQIRNQDPTKPMDAEALTQQLVQFAGVEQQLAGNRTLERLLALQQAGQLAEAAPLIGRRVALETDRLPLQDGQAEVLLPAAGRAGRAVVEVRDAGGALLRRAEVPLGPAPASWRWDGTDARGTRRPDGAYRVEVSGRTAEGTAVPLEGVVAGRVTGAAREGGELVLRLGAARIGFERLRELRGG